MKIDEAINLVATKLEDATIYGSEMVSKCPFCNSPKHKFYLNTKTGLYNCKRGSCGVKGNLTTLFKHLNIDEVVEHEGTSFIPKKKKHKLEFDESTIRKISKDDYMVGYMMSRGISHSSLVKMGVMYSTKNECVAFITFLDKKMVGVVYRDDKKRIYMEKGSQQCLWGFDEATPRKGRLYITEGHIDALTLCEMGIDNVVSMPNGTRSQEWINVHWDKLNKFTDIVLCYDNDQAGREGLSEARSRLSFANLYELEYGDYNDINEYFMNDAEGLFNTVNNPKMIDMDGFISLQEVLTSKDMAGELSDSGLKQINRMFGGLAMFQSTIICSESGSGKTTVVSNLAKGLMAMDDKVAMWSGELSNTQLKTWLYSTIAGEKAVEKTPHPFREGDFIYNIKSEYEEKINKAVENKLFVYDGNMSNGYKMIDHFEKLHKKFGVKWFFIDNLSVLDMSRKGLGKYEAEEMFSKKVASFTRNNRVHLFLVMHPVKENLNSDPNYLDKKGRVKKPEKYDQYSVKGSSSIVNLAHNILFLNKATEHHKAWFVQKISGAMTKRGDSPEKINAMSNKIMKEFSLLMYLVKNRLFGYVYEDALFGYSPETRRIFGLNSKEEDLSKEVLKSDDTEDDGFDIIDDF